MYDSVIVIGEWWLLILSVSSVVLFGPFYQRGAVDISSSWWTRGWCAGFPFVIFWPDPFVCRSSNGGDDTRFNFRTLTVWVGVYIFVRVCMFFIDTHDQTSVLLTWASWNRTCPSCPVSMVIFVLIVEVVLFTYIEFQTDMLHSWSFVTTRFCNKIANCNNFHIAISFSTRFIIKLTTGLNFDVSAKSHYRMC